MFPWFRFSFGSWDPARHIRWRGHTAQQLEPTRRRILGATPARSGLQLLTLAACNALGPVAAAESPAADAGWQVAGQQGLVRFVVVPLDQAGDRAVYAQVIAALCQPERTCFLNFYSNSRGAAVTLPLPDAIASEATATYRQSLKNGVQRLQWSCRMQRAEGECF
ncbi:MAG: hypothetical protein AB9M60_16445 [Leptothrix sp. (in: b-proteobacteria)]